MSTLTLGHAAQGPALAIPAHHRQQHLRRALHLRRLLVDLAPGFAWRHPVTSQESETRQGSSQVPLKAQA